METFVITAITQIPTINESIDLVYSTFNKIISHRHARFVINELETIDVIPIINSIEVFINKNNDFNEKDILFLTSERIRETIHKIHIHIKNIQRKLDEYDKSWITWVLGINISYELDELRKQKMILTNRIDMFIRIIMMNKLIDK